MWSVAFHVIAFLGATRGQLNLLGLNVPDLGLNLPLSTNKQPSLLTEKNKKCEPSVSLYTNGLHPCKNQLIFEDLFDGNFLNRQKWTVEQYIPTIKGPDFEFVSYENSDKTVFIKDGRLIINPRALQEEEEVKGVLDLSDGCTREDSECRYEQVSVFYLPVVRSGKLSSKFSFTYGKIEVRAKLPRGDWIYPQLELLPAIKSSDGVKMWIGYSRGNDHYIGPQGDTGSEVLFGGLVLGNKEPERSAFVYNRTSAFPYSGDMHLYTLIWEPGKITVSVDNNTYGTLYLDETDKRFGQFRSDFHVSFGVGVGGINDFPDGYVSSRPKPWKNMDRKQVKDFFDARRTWLNTWNEKDKQLQIDYVRIWAL